MSLHLVFAQQSRLEDRGEIPGAEDRGALAGDATDGAEVSGAHASDTPFSPTTARVLENVALYAAQNHDRERGRLVSDRTPVRRGNALNCRRPPRVRPDQHIHVHRPEESDADMFPSLLLIHPGPPAARGRAGFGGTATGKTGPPASVTG